MLLALVIAVTIKKSQNTALGCLIMSHHMHVSSRRKSRYIDRSDDAVHNQEKTRFKIFK